MRQHAVDVLDIKEPLSGPLGCPELSIVKSILSIGRSSKQLTSLALGELNDNHHDLESFFAAADPSKLLHYVKFGLADQAGRSWQPTANQLVAKLPPHVKPVVCTYVDRRPANAPSVVDVLRYAAQRGVELVLLDTFDKSAGDFFKHVSANEFLEFKKIAHAIGVQLVIAGSLRLDSIARAIALHPSIIGVRGAACLSNDRTSSISAESIDKLLRRFPTKVQRSNASCNAAQRELRLSASGTFPKNT